MSCQKSILETLIIGIVINATASFQSTSQWQGFQATDNMDRSFCSLALFLFNVILVVNGENKGIQCFIPGECLDSQVLAYEQIDRPKECLHYCQVKSKIYHLLSGSLMSLIGDGGL